jgi:hypothetical protein
VIYQLSEGRVLLVPGVPQNTGLVFCLHIHVVQYSDRFSQKLEREVICGIKLEAIAVYHNSLYVYFTSNYKTTISP